MDCGCAEGVKDRFVADIRGTPSDTVVHATIKGDDMVRMLRVGGLVTLAVALLTSFGVSTASADPPPGGVCLGEFLPATFVYNPDNPSFFEQVDKNRDGVVCLKDWTGPDPDPLIGFLVIDNTGRHNNLP